LSRSANITFGSPYDEKRYLATLKACQLERDLEIFELGDETEVGEKGTACSGGQKVIYLSEINFRMFELPLIDFRLDL
jgi:ABC-type multidrug transport system fused ATPase/permease subunit